MVWFRHASPLKKLAIQGTVWVVAGFGTSQVLRLASNLILTRLLFPELFGVMALVHTVLVGVQLFSDIGLGPSIVRHERGDHPDFLNTAWTLQVLRGAVLWMGVTVAASPLARFYGEPRLLWLLPLVGLSAVISGFNSTALFTLQRRLAVRLLTAYELAGQSISIAVMLIWAYLDPSVWALVAGGFASSLFQLAWSHRLNPGPRNRFAWDRNALAELASFGKWIFLSTAMTFLASQADRLVLAKLFSLEFLGVYVIGASLAGMPLAVMTAVSARVVFPSFSRLIGLPRREFRRKIKRSRGPLLSATVVGLALIVGFSDYAVSIMYDSRYSATAWIIPILAIGTWPIILSQTINPALLAVGNPRVVSLGSFLSFITQTAGIVLGGLWMGHLGAVAGIAISSIPAYVITLCAARREGLGCLDQDGLLTLFFTMSLLVIGAGRVALGLGLPATAS